MKYDFKKIEKKWQKKWDEEKLYQVDVKKSAKPFYNLMMFPYPSAEGLHVGNMYAFTGSDIYGRYQRLKGNDVFEPIGLDGFGIHSENFAIKNKIHPAVMAEKTQKRFYEQLHMIGNAYDWSKTLETYDPNYYKWTQWLFLQMYKRGLAYKKKAAVNWCPSCMTVLSDEQVEAGLCERCKTEVVKKDMSQWFFKITDYAEKLLKNIDKIDWTEKTKLAQKNWIGKSEGIEIEYKIVDSDKKIICFTTRPDTNFGATFVVLAPESKVLNEMVTDEHKKEVEDYVKKSLAKSEQDRIEEGREKTGVFTGAYCINNLTGKKMPIWVSDFVLGNVGTGAVVGVPGHDIRDFEFAKKFKLPIIRVVIGKDNDTSEIIEAKQVQEKEGKMINSDFLNGLDIHDATKKIMDYLEKKSWGQRVVNYKLRDWCISRQRFWGPPIPIVYCESCAKRKPKIILVHGIYGHSKENWFPWFKQEMENRGYEVLIPDLPNNEHPKMNEWISALEKLPIKKDDQIYLIGHSLGAPAACQFALKNKLNIEKLILVAPTGNSQGELNWNNLKNAGCDDEALAIIKEFNELNIGLDELSKLVKEKVIYLSDNDPYIPLEVKKDYEVLNAKVSVFKNKGHFNETAGIKELPEILFEFPDSINSGIIPVPEEDLPVMLPKTDDYLPDGTDRSPLARNLEFVNTKCPKCGGEAKRETDVSDTFLDSSWYFLRYPSVDIKDQPFDKEITKKWLPVDMYIGGHEHAVLHLLYTRFVTMVLHDLGMIDFEEPFKKFRAHGLIIKDGAKMSKSKGNVVNPDLYIEKYGADVLRTYLMFIGPLKQGGDFRDEGVVGIERFFGRLFFLVSQVLSSLGTQDDVFVIQRNKLIKKATHDVEELDYNTIIASSMEFLNLLDKQKDKISKIDIETLLIILSPFAPHFCEEMWETLGNKESVFKASWPLFDESKMKEEKVKMIIQINGKVRDFMEVDTNISEEKASELVQKREKIMKYIVGKKIKKMIFVKGRLINIVV
ncbi:MAG: leucine--tRNA ligase [Patescibacteria group bacterium]|jgi:leucyl-tRNA synthetase